MCSRIQLSLDKFSFTSKPSGRHIQEINNRLANGRIAVSVSELQNVIKKIGEQGFSFSPATFRDGKRSKETFEQQQLFVLDIDNEHPQEKLLTPKEALLRADENHLPILMIYETFSSTVEHPRFRILFLNDAPVTDKRLAEDMNQMLGRIFPEADRSCVSDYSKIYFGGKEILYESNSYCTDTINIELLWRQFNLYLRKTDPKHCKAILERFLKGDELHITTTTDSEFTPNATDLKNGDNLHSSIIYSNIGEGRKSPFYNVTYTQGISKNSLPPDRKNIPSSGANYHKLYKSTLLEKIPPRCRLFGEFVSGSRELTHEELSGIGMALVNVEGGRNFFLKTCVKYPHLHSKPNYRDEWAGQLSYFSKHNYSPQNCDGFCVYCDECNHGKNMLSVPGQRKGTIEKLSDDDFELCDLATAEERLQEVIHEACSFSSPEGVVVISAQCGLGKSEDILNEALSKKILMALPTNILKEDLYDRAVAKDVDLVMTPSLDAIYDELPEDVAHYIQKLRKNGMSHEVHPYIKDLLKNNDISVLKQYMTERERAIDYDGSLLTTHRNFSVKEYDEKYDAYIVDEDIMLDTYISSHQEVSKKKLKRALHHAPIDSDQRVKLKELLRLLKESREGFVKLDSLEWENNESKDTPKFYGFDLKAFFKAERFYIRPENKKLGVKEAVLFVDPPSFPRKNFTVLSATANETIYRAVFGNNVEFKMLPRAKYRGQLIQYYGLSMSRSCLHAHPGLIPHIQKRLNIDDAATLTYKGYVSNELYFGNLVGNDRLKGMDSLVIGSAYQPPYVYGLAAMALDLPFDENLTMKYQAVEYNGCRFWYNTFEDPVLREIQMWMTESELEQAIGRSRLLRTDATVYVCSNFPLRQADYRDGRIELYGDYLSAYR